MFVLDENLSQFCIRYRAVKEDLIFLAELENLKF